ncbi:MAG: patatin-like phospholipase family protein [Burkholderiales bacterium]|nr:patatin-like phospholipase family protein [Burkholderiales bacterium]
MRSRTAFHKWIVLALAAALSACVTSPVNYTGKDAPRTERITPLTAPRPIIGLVLGAGGSRGFAHVGVIKALEAAGIEPDLLVGASSGAIVASLYAGGYRAESLEKIALQVEDNDLLDFTLFGPGVIEGGRLQEFINETLGNRPIEALDKPFAAIAAERETNRMTVFNRGNTGLAVRASASVPRLFWPVIIRGAEYVDGGVASRVPAPVARAMGADIVIAVDVSWRGSTEAELADIVIRPPTIRSRITDFQHKLENMAAGEEATRAVIPRIRELIAKVTNDKHKLTQLDPRATAVVAR